MEPLAPEIWSQKASVHWHRLAVDSGFWKIVLKASVACFWTIWHSFGVCVMLARPHAFSWSCVCAPVCTKALCAYWAELMLIDFDRVWRIGDCVCVCWHLCLVCVCNLAVSCCFFQWSFLLSLSLFSPPVPKAEQEMAFSPSQYPKQGQRVSNSFLFLACPIYHRNEAIKMCVWDLALSYLSVCALHWTCSLFCKCLHLCMCVCVCEPNCQVEIAGKCPWKLATF